mmetsp:Transcript_3483/g.8399  ORF Transcript_3483/g.8399 Transcript_3483/m.8399 type:complete len:205 (+) Transcript_3483:402-1016(+)
MAPAATARVVPAGFRWDGERFRGRCRCRCRCGSRSPRVAHPEKGLLVALVSFPRGLDIGVTPLESPALPAQLALVQRHGGVDMRMIGCGSGCGFGSRLGFFRREPFQLLLMMKLMMMVVFRVSLVLPIIGSSLTGTQSVAAATAAATTTATVHVVCCLVLLLHELSGVQENRSALLWGQPEFLGALSRGSAIFRVKGRQRRVEQ